MSGRYNRTYAREDGRDEDFRPKSRGAIIMMIILAAGIIAILVYTYVTKNAEYTSWEEVSSYDNIPNALCLKTEKGFILYNCDGAEGHSADGRTTWKISYDITSPIAVSAGDCAAVADRGGHTINVTDGSGENYSIEVSEKISDICVAAQGVTAVRTDAGESDHIYLYSITGELLLDIKTEVRHSGFPVSMALSSDGRKLVTSYVKAGEEQESWITFYNFGDVGQSYSDKIVGSYSFADSFLPDIRFIGDDRVLVSGSEMSKLYKFREIPELLSDFDVSGGLASVASYGNGFVLVTKHSNGINAVETYDRDGNKQSVIETGINYDSINLFGDDIIMTTGDACIIYRKNGKEKFRAGLSDQIVTMYPSGTDATYTIVYNNRTQVIRLKTKSEENQGVAASE